MAPAISELLKRTLNIMWMKGTWVQILFRGCLGWIPFFIFDNSFDEVCNSKVFFHIAAARRSRIRSTFCVFILKWLGSRPSKIRVGMLTNVLLNKCEKTHSYFSNSCNSSILEPEETKKFSIGSNNKVYVAAFKWVHQLVKFFITSSCS